MTEKEVYKFPFILTTIDAVESSTESPPPVKTYGEGAKYVTFDGTTHDKKDTDMVFLMDPSVAKEDVGGELDEDKQIHAQISAVSVSKEFFKKSLQAYAKKHHNGRVLICVHGFNNEPSYWMRRCDMNLQETKVKSFKKANPVVLPVLWPTFNNVWYKSSQDLAEAAGNILGQNLAFLSTGSDISMNLLCHSMGSRVVMHYAMQLPESPEQVYDNIFFIAADMWEEIFNERLITDSLPCFTVRPPLLRGNKWQDAGLKLCKSVKKSDASDSLEKKVHIYHYAEDERLAISINMNLGRARLGAMGTLKDDFPVHPECKKLIRNVNMMTHLKEEVLKADKGGHCYEVMDHLVDDIAKCLTVGYKSTNPDTDEYYNHDLENKEVEKL